MSEIARGDRYITWRAGESIDNDGLTRQDYQGEHHINTNRGQPREQSLMEDMAETAASQTAQDMEDSMEASHIICLPSFTLNVNKGNSSHR